MKKNVYLAYNFEDTSVAPLKGVEGETSVKDYIEIAEKELKKCSFSVADVYRCKEETGDISTPNWVTLWDQVKDQLINSQATILFISPNMMDAKLPVKAQWPAWNLYFSIHNMDRANGNTKLPVAAVVLPDQKGSTAYFDEEKAFPMLKENIKNGYIYVTNWNLFSRNPDIAIDVAADRAEAVKHSDVCLAI